MIRMLCFFGCFILSALGLNSQSLSSPIHKQIEEMRILCNTIRQEHDLLKSRARVQDSLSYSQLRMDIYKAFNDIRRINFDLLNTTDKIAVTGLFAKLLQANNPTSEILGFRFHETMLKATEKHLQCELPAGPERKRFTQVVAKIVNNPVISSLANTNPITSVTAAIIGTAAQFSTTLVKVEKDGNKVKDVSATTADAFNQKAIEAFLAELQPYITFYDALNMASAKYLSGLESITKKFNYLKVNVETYKSQLYASLQVNDTNTLIRLATLLPDPASGSLDFSKYLKDQKVHQCSRMAFRFSFLEESVMDFRKEYDQNLYTFLKDYNNILESSKKLPAASVDHSKIDDLIKDINAFIYHEINK